MVLSGLLVDERKHGLGGHTLITLVRNKALGAEASRKDGEPLLPQVRPVADAGDHLQVLTKLTLKF